MKKALALAIVLISFLSKADDICSRVSSKADEDRIIIPSDESGYRVIGEGRVYFHSAPNEQCTIENLFLVPGDRVNAFADYNGYTYVIFFTNKAEDVEGWVQSNRLIPTGTGIGPSQSIQNEMKSLGE